MLRRGAQKAAGQIGYWEQRKAGLKNMECGSLEEIAGKLDMLHTYEDEIAAAKASDVSVGSRFSAT